MHHEKGAFKTRKKANSVSNGILGYLKSKNKKVTFYNDSYSSSQVFTSSSASSSEEDLKGMSRHAQSHRRTIETLLRFLMNADIHTQSDGMPLTKTVTYPAMETKSDGKPIGTNQPESDELPEFNKRPLTDTPIVSGVTSPATGDLSDEENDSDSFGFRKQRTDNNSQGRLTKNISHLNLSEMDHPASNSISPTATLDNLPLRNEETVKVQMSQEAKANILQDVPEDLQKKFESTPSIEHLKNLLMKKPPPSARKAYTLNIPGQTSSKISPDGRIASVDVGSKLVIVMVGLPARGKSYITNKLTRYLNWLQHDCRVFNVGNTRRKDTLNNSGPEANPLPDVNTPNSERQSPSPQENPTSPPKAEAQNADFFSPTNQTSVTLREKWAMDTLDQLLNYVLDGSGSVGIFDATNSTKRRRLKVLKRIQERSNGELKVLFLESICSDPAIIESNIRLKLSGPDYKNMDPEDALKDFVGRLHNYEQAYEAIDESEESIPGFQYVKMIDVGKKVVSYNIQGFLSSQTIYFLLNFNLCERQIWITRHGESVDNLSGRIGGDSVLTERGRKFSETLCRFMEFQRKEFRKDQLERFSTRLVLRYNNLFNQNEIQDLDNIPTEPNFYVWTSMLTRAVETGQYFDDQLYSVKQMRMLNELGGGKFDGMTYEDIQNKFPKEFQARLKSKLTYRYPGVGGESYLDVLTRLRPLITEIERTTDHLLIISHRVVLRILLAYFLNLDRSMIGELDVPLHTLYCLELKPYGTDYRMYEYDEGLDWFVKVEPEHHKNIKEVGVEFRERKYSVVPTAPPTSSRNAKPKPPAAPKPKLSTEESFSVRRSLSASSGLPNYFRNAMNAANTTNDENEANSKQASISSKKLADLNKLRKP